MSHNPTQSFINSEHIFHANNSKPFQFRLINLRRFFIRFSAFISTSFSCYITTPHFVISFVYGNQSHSFWLACYCCWIYFLSSPKPLMHWMKENWEISQVISNAIASKYSLEQFLTALRLCVKKYLNSLVGKNEYTSLLSI